MCPAYVHTTDRTSAPQGCLCPAHPGTLSRQPYATPYRSTSVALQPPHRRPCPGTARPGHRQRLGLTGLGLLAALWPALAPAQELIANPDVGMDRLTRNEARLYFTLAIQEWPNHHPIRVFVLPDADPVHTAFVKRVLGLFPRQLRGVWDRQVFTGTGQAPTAVADEAEMIRRVMTTPGAIGYTGSPPQDPRIRTLEVD